MQYKKDCLFAFLFTILTCYMLQATYILNPEDNQDNKALNVTCLPVKNRVSINLVPKLSSSHISLKKISDIIQSSRSADSIHLYDLSSDLLSTILGYVGMAEPRAVSQLFYYYVTGEFVEDDIKAKGMSEGRHSRGISGEKDYSYDLQDSFLYFKNEEKSEILFRKLPIEEIPTWFWQRWIKKIDNISRDQMNFLKGINIHTLNFIWKNMKENWPDLYSILYQTLYLSKPDDISEKCPILFLLLQGTDIDTLNFYSSEINECELTPTKTTAYKNIHISSFNCRVFVADSCCYF